MPDEHDGKGIKRLGMYRGVVRDNADPRKIGRCRVAVEGITPDDGGAWAYPIGWPGSGGGGPGTPLGMYAPPPVDADVCVWFEMGDVERPFYTGGNPGVDEVPAEVSDPATSVEDAPLVHAWETARWRIKIDGRPGHEECHIIDKVTGDTLEIDGVNYGVRVKGTSAVQITSLGSIVLKAPNIVIGDRTVVKNGKPIG